jgi:hypothetical protein
MMNDWSRRNLLRATAGAAVAVPMAALGGSVATAAPRPSSGDAQSPDGPVDVRGPVMFCVHDAHRGEVSILHGTTEVIVQDRQLVARILTAAAGHPQA